MRKERKKEGQGKLALGLGCGVYGKESGQAKVERKGEKARKRKR